MIWPICYFPGEESPGVVRTAATTYGSGHCWSKWLRQEYAVEDTATGLDQDRSDGQTVRHEPQGHAKDTGMMSSVS